MNFWTGPARFRYLFVFLYLSFSARAAVLESCDEPSLRAAIGNGGRITFACNGTIYPSQPLVISTDTIIDGLGHQIVISGGGEVQIFTVNPGVHFELLNLTVADGRNTNGGGLLNHGNVTLTSCIFSNNSAVADRGANGVNGTSGGTDGGVVGGDGTAGSAGDVARGGAIYNSGDLVISNSWFSHNVARGGDGGSGGAGGAGGQSIDQFGRCRFGSRGGHGGNGGGGGQAFGGAIYNAGKLWCFSTLLDSDSARGGLGGLSGAVGAGGCGSPGARAGIGGAGGSASGAGIYNAGELTFAGGTFHAELCVGGVGGTGGAGEFIIGMPGAGGPGGDALGGALYSAVSNWLVNATMVENRTVGGAGGCGGSAGPPAATAANGNGGNSFGGALANSGRCILGNSTIWLNGSQGGFGTNAGTCGGIGTNGTVFGSTLYSSNAPIEIYNSVLGNPASSSNCFGPFIDLGHNLCSDDSFPITTSSSRNHTNPLLGPLRNNGGTTPTVAPLANSPAVDQGDDALAPERDQRGVLRPQGTHSDIGAFEQTYLSIVTVVPFVWLVTYTGVPNENYGLEFTFDLEHWIQEESQVADSSGVVQFEEAVAGPASWFRMILLH